MDAGNSGTTAPNSQSTSNAPTNSSNVGGNSEGMAPRSFSEQLRGYASAKKEGSSNLSDRSVEATANAPARTSESPSSQLEQEEGFESDPNELSLDGQQSENQEISSGEEQQDSRKPWFQQRIDKLTAKYRSEQETHKQLALESAKKDEAIKILQEQLNRISQRAQLDPHEEQIEELRLQHRLQELDREIPQRVEETWTQKQQEMVIQEKTQELVSAVRTAAAKYQGLLTPKDILAFMQQTGEDSARIAAEKVYRQRLQAAQKFIGVQPQAPATAAGQQASIRELSTPKKYGSIRDAWEDMKAERSGRQK